MLENDGEIGFGAKVKQLSHYIAHQLHNMPDAPVVKLQAA